MCTLRATGKTFDVDRFLKRCPWKASAIFHRGDVRGKTTAGSSSFNIGVSDASWCDLSAQIRDATKFIIRNGASLRRLRRFPGVESVTLDFPIECRLNPKAVWVQEERFPEVLLELAGKYGLEIALSIYPPSSKKSRSK